MGVVWGVGRLGFEPRTLGLKVRCSDQTELPARRRDARFEGPAAPCRQALGAWCIFLLYNGTFEWVAALRGDPGLLGGRGRVSNQLFQLIAILATAKLPEDRLSRAVFVLIRVAQTQSCWQMARSMRASVPFEGDHYGRTWANQLRNAPFRRISWSRWVSNPPLRCEGSVGGWIGGTARTV